jgi:hypothetical protein
MSKQCRGRATRGWGGSRARKRRSLGRDALGPREGGGPNPVATCKAPGIASLVPVLLTQVTQFDLPLGRVDDIRNSAAMTSKSLTAAAQHIRIINPPPPRRHAGDHNIRQHQTSAISHQPVGRRASTSTHSFQAVRRAGRPAVQLLVTHSVRLTTADRICSAVLLSIVGLTSAAVRRPRVCKALLDLAT